VSVPASVDRVTVEPTSTPVPIGWPQARSLAYQAGRRSARAAVAVPLADADGRTLIEPLVTRTPLPAFPTSSVDGWAVRGAGPWRIVGRVLAGDSPTPLEVDGTGVEIATGAMVPRGTGTIVRTEDCSVTDGLVQGAPRARQEWREPGEEATEGEQLIPAGSLVTPAVIGLAASCGYDTLMVSQVPRAELRIFGDELLTSGPPAEGRVRDALGPALPGWLRRLGAQCRPPGDPVADTLEAHLDAIRSAFDAGADLVCTTGGTMLGPVDHLRPALTELGARLLVPAVRVRPGYPMLLAELPDGRFLAGLPGNPLSAVVALVCLVAPLLAGLTGRPEPELERIRLASDIAGRGDFHHLALVDHEGAAVRHVGSSMLRGLARSAGFAVIEPGGQGQAGDQVPVVPLPLLVGEGR